MRPEDHIIEVLPADGWFVYASWPEPPWYQLYAVEVWAVVQPPNQPIELRAVYTSPITKGQLFMRPKDCLHASVLTDERRAALSREGAQSMKALIEAVEHQVQMHGDRLPNGHYREPAKHAGHRAARALWDQWVDTARRHGILEP